MADRPYDAQCLFCKIVRRELPAQIVHEDGAVLAFRDARPVAPLHVLVVPKRHVPSLAEADAELAGTVAAAAARIARESGQAAGGYRVVTNVGPDAGQSVPHLHFHVLAGRGLGWPPG